MCRYNMWSAVVSEEKTFLAVTYLEDEVKHVQPKRSSSAPPMRSTFNESEAAPRYLMWDQSLTETLTPVTPPCAIQLHQPAAQTGQHFGALHFTIPKDAQVPISPRSSGTEPSSYDSTQADVMGEGQSEESENNDHSSRTRRRRRHGGPRIRPCKGKRERLRRLIDRLTTLVDEDPDSFDLQALSLPPSVEAQDVLQRKVKRAVEAHRATVLQMPASAA